MSQNLNIANFSNVNGHLSFEQNDAINGHEKGNEATHEDTKEFEEVTVK